jgi:hypothetical protein
MTGVGLHGVPLMGKLSLTGKRAGIFLIIGRPALILALDIKLFQCLSPSIPCPILQRIVSHRTENRMRDQ